MTCWRPSQLGTKSCLLWTDGPHNSEIGNERWQSQTGPMWWHAVFALSFSVVSGPWGPVRRPLSIPAQLLICQQWSMSCKGRGGEEKVGTWLEVAWDNTVGSWWVTAWLCVFVDWGNLRIPKTGGVVYKEAGEGEPESHWSHCVI